MICPKALSLVTGEEVVVRMRMYYAERSVFALPVCDHMIVIYFSARTRLLLDSTWTRLLSAELDSTWTRLLSAELDSTRTKKQAHCLENRKTISSVQGTVQTHSHAGFIRHGSSAKA